MRRAADGKNVSGLPPRTPPGGNDSSRPPRGVCESPGYMWQEGRASLSLVTENRMVETSDFFFRKSMVFGIVRKN